MYEGVCSFATVKVGFNLVKTIDKGASNTYIEYIFDACDDLIDGKSICGAGGGGFLQVILKEGVKKSDLRERVKNVFKNCGVELWECELI
jgi:fucokinase